jgi:hypothetical protein
MRERIVWMASPTVMAPPPLARAVSFVFFVLSAISLSFAVRDRARAAHAPARPMLFSVWCASLGIAAREVPRIWLKRARLRGDRAATSSPTSVHFGGASIARRSASRASFGTTSDRNAGDLELVRACHTGALRRKLTLKLYGVARAGSRYGRSCAAQRRSRRPAAWGTSLGAALDSR